MRNLCSIWRPIAQPSRKNRGKLAVGSRVGARALSLASECQPVRVDIVWTADWSTRAS